MLQSPIGTREVHPRQQEVARCLEAVSAAGQVAGRLWSLQRRKRNDGALCPAPPHSSSAWLLMRCQTYSAHQSSDRMSNNLHPQAGLQSALSCGCKVRCSEPSGWVAAIRQSSVAVESARSLPGALKMDEKAHVLTSEDQRYTGHTQVGSCMHGAHAQRKALHLPSYRVFTHHKAISSDYAIHVHVAACRRCSAWPSSMTGYCSHPLQISPSW